MAKKVKLELTEEKVRQTFGEPRLIKNSEWIYACPFCLDEGCDKDCQAPNLWSKVKVSF